MAAKISLINKKYKNMTSIKRTFEKLSKQHPDWSTYTCFAETVYAQLLNQKIISRWFNKLVDKDDYAKKDKNDILTFLGSLQKGLRSVKNEE